MVFLYFLLFSPLTIDQIYHTMAQQQQQQVNIADLDMNALQQVKGQLEEVLFIWWWF